VLLRKEIKVSLTRQSMPNIRGLQMGQTGQSIAHAEAMGALEVLHCGWQL